MRYLLYGIGFLVVTLVLIALFTLLPIDRTPYKEKPFYSEMMETLEEVQQISIPEASSGFSIGYAVENLTPSSPLATAGYGNRKGKTFTAVHDSIYVRCLVIDNGTSRVAIVSADLLIIPPTVTALLEEELPSIGFNLNNTYLGATHTHNSIGNWGEGATRFIYGAYSDSVVSFIVSKIKKSIERASQNRLPAFLKTGTIPVPQAVRNRIDEEDGRVDSLLRVVEVHRSDSSKLVMLSYTAHATCLYSRDLELSRDYPGALVDELEQRGYTFAMFLAGAVGSHGCNPPKYGWSCLDWMSDRISSKLYTHKATLQKVADSTLMMIRTPLKLGEPQVKIAKDWRVRPWIFKKAFGEYQPYLTALRIGNIIMLGTPCDFSGELTGPLDSLAEQNGMHAMVTSFNGHYIGYITKDRHYDNAHYETRLMNWYGPGNGAYMTECLGELIEALSN